MIPTLPLFFRAKRGENFLYDSNTWAFCAEGAGRFFFSKTRSRNGAQKVSVSHKDFFAVSELGFRKKFSPRLRRKRLLCCYHIKNFLRAFGARFKRGWGSFEVVIFFFLVSCCNYRKSDGPFGPNGRRPVYHPPDILTVTVHYTALISNSVQKKRSVFTHFQFSSTELEMSKKPKNNRGRVSCFATSKSIGGMKVMTGNLTK